MAQELQNLEGRVLNKAVEVGMDHRGQSLAGMITFYFHSKCSGESLEGTRWGG